MMWDYLLPILVITAAWIAFGLLRADDSDERNEECSSCDESDSCSDHFCIRKPQPRT